MSRIGKAPIAIPAGVTITDNDGILTVKGPKGTLSQDYDVNAISVEMKDGVLTVLCTGNASDANAKHGLYRALFNNMVIGVTNGFQKGLVVNGVGFKVAVQGKKLVMNVGYSHPVEIEAEEGITFDCPTQTEVVVKGIDKVRVGQVAANIRKVRKPEPYHGYGIRYADEVIERKEGKTAGK